MKAFALLAALALAGCSHTTSAPTTVVQPALETQSGNGWQFQAPVGVHLVQHGSPSDPMLIDDNSNIFVLVRKAPAPIPVELLLATIGISLQHSGFALSQLDAVIWLNHQGATFQAARNNLATFHWISIVDGQGIAFTCGGLVSDKSRNDVWCHQMAESFTLSAGH